MHDFTAPLSPQLAAALQRVWRAPTAGNRLRVVVGTKTRTQAELDDWERDGGTTAREPASLSKRDQCDPPDNSASSRSGT
jgi:hypothetical protein